MPKGGKRRGAGRPAKGMVKVGLALPPETVKTIDKLAKAEDCTKSDVVVKAVERYAE